MKASPSLALLFLVAASLTGFSRDSDVPQLRAEVVCYNGKLGSGSSCTANASKRGTAPEKNGKMTCGFPGKVSEITWSFIERRDRTDVYSFTRRFPIKSADTVTQTKGVEFSGRRVTVFEDKDQVIVMQSPKQ